MSVDARITGFTKTHTNGKLMPLQKKMLKAAKVVGSSLTFSFKKKDEEWIVCYKNYEKNDFTVSIKQPHGWTRKYYYHYNGSMGRNNSADIEFRGSNCGSSHELASQRLGFLKKRIKVLQLIKHYFANKLVVLN